MTWDFLPLPKQYDRQQMWRALERLNKGSHTWTAKLQRTLHQSYMTASEWAMSDLEPPRFIENRLPEHLARMPQVERAIAMVVSEKV